MYKSKVRKGVVVTTKTAKGIKIVIDGNKEHSQEQLKKWHDMGLTHFVTKKKKNEEDTDSDSDN